MKVVKTLLCTLLLLLGLYACGSHPYPHAMQVADSLVHIRPKRALSLLSTLKDSIGNEAEGIRIYYHLLCTKAQDEVCIKHTSDSLIRQVIHYFQKKKDKNRLPEALYYAGRVYEDLGDAPQALEYFQRAKDEAESGTDYNLLSRAYSGIGRLFAHQDIYEEAPGVFRKAYHYSLLTKDSVRAVYDLCDIARSYSNLSRADSAVYYYQMAGRQAEHLKNSHLRAVVNSELSGCYTALGRHGEAYKAMQVSLSQGENLDIYPLHSAIACYYEHTNQLDSAAHRFSGLLHANNYIVKKEAYRGLYSIAKQRGETNKALSYLEHYLVYTDSMHKMRQTESVQKISALYDYQQSKKENRKLRIPAFHERRSEVFFSVAFVFSVLLLIAYGEYHNRKEQTQKVQREKYEKIKKEQYKLSLAQIKKNKEGIEILEFPLQGAESLKEQLQGDLLKAQKALIERSNEQIESKQKAQVQAETKLRESDIYKKFHRVRKEGEEKEPKINNTDWQELIRITDETYDQFRQRLQGLYPMTDIELRVCLLIKIGLSPLQIATITIRSKQAISSIRKRLYSKLFNEEGNTAQWDNFIQNF